MEYETTAHAIHRLVSHLIWCPKYRRPVREGPVAGRLRELVAAVADQHGWGVVDVAVQPDHVHLFLRCLPTDPPHRVVRALKGRTSRVLRHEFPALKRRLPTLWTRSSFVSTAGHVSAATIQRYLAAQQGV